jgi:hypothetical protein
MGDPPHKNTDRPGLPYAPTPLQFGRVTTNAYEIADFAAMHKRKLLESF